MATPLPFLRILHPPTHHRFLQQWRRGGEKRNYYCYYCCVMCGKAKHARMSKMGLEGSCYCKDMGALMGRSAFFAKIFCCGCCGRRSVGFSEEDRVEAEAYNYSPWERVGTNHCSWFAGGACKKHSQKLHQDNWKIHVQCAIFRERDQC